MWLFRYTDLGEANYIYWIGLGMIAIAFFFDKYIHAQFGLSEWRKVRAGIKSESRVKAIRDLAELEKDNTAGHYAGHESDYKRKEKHLKKIIRKSL